VSSGNRRASGRFFPIEIRADIGAPCAASLTGKPRLYIGRPEAIRPSLAADRRPMAALVIRAIDQQTANADGAHLGEGDFVLAGEGGHAPLKRGLKGESNCLIDWGQHPTKMSQERQPETSVIFIGSLPVERPARHPPVPLKDAPLPAGPCPHVRMHADEER
jgi:hypothetical protein